MVNKAALMALILCVSSSLSYALGIQAEHAWSRATVAGQTMGGIFLEVHNANSQDVTLISAVTPIAERAELHTHINDHGVMRMRAVEGGVVIPARQTVSFQPGGYHIMLFGLKKALTDSMSFPVTLHFQQEKPITITVTVRKPMPVKGHPNHSAVEIKHHDEHHHHM